MAIKTSEYGIDISETLAKRADHILASASGIVKRIEDRNNIDLEKLDKLGLSSSLYSIIFIASQISAYGHEVILKWDKSWPDKIYDRGFESFNFTAK
jgi:hypothetical protein